MTKDATVPEARISVAGSPIPSGLFSRLRTVEIELALNTPGRFRLVFSDPGFAWFDADLLDFGQEVQIAMGYLGEHEVVSTGIVSRRNIDLQRSGAPELEIAGVDALIRLKRSRQTRTFLEQKSADVVSQVASDHSLSADCDDTGAAEPYIIQNNQSDLDFVLELAGEAGMEIWFDDSFHCKRPDYSQTPVADFTWEQNLLAFRPRFSTASAAAKVVVRGWDPQRKEPIQAEVTQDDNKGSGKSIVDLCGDLTQVTQVTANVTSVQEAERLAKSIMARSAAAALTALCETAGHPLVLPAVMVNLVGVGERLSGPYMVTAATHRLNARGYLTSFTVRRNAFAEPAAPEEAEPAEQAEEETVDIEVTVINALEEALPDTDYVITLADGTERQGTTDSEGKLIESGVPRGRYKIEIKDLDVTMVGRA